jgi:hypothetical protein
MFVHPTLHLMLARRHREELAAAADRHRRVRSLDHPKGVTALFAASEPSCSRLWPRSPPGR